MTGQSKLARAARGGGARAATAAGEALQQQGYVPQNKPSTLAAALALAVSQVLFQRKVGPPAENQPRKCNKEANNNSQGVSHANVTCRELTGWQATG
jgi:hypothetical protein